MEGHVETSTGMKRPIDAMTHPIDAMTHHIDALSDILSNNTLSQYTITLSTLSNL